MSLHAALQTHLETRGDSRVAPELVPTLERGARRVRMLQRNGVNVELSPHMKRLLELEGRDVDDALFARAQQQELTHENQ
jgi:hypothetical protein